MQLIVVEPVKESLKSRLPSNPPGDLVGHPAQPRDPRPTPLRLHLALSYTVQEQQHGAGCHLIRLVIADEVLVTGQVEHHQI